MYRLMGAVVVAFVLSSGAVGAQDWTSGGWGGCPTCRVVSWVDTVSPSFLAGWGFQCQSGRPVERFDVYYTDAAGLHRVTDAWWITGLWRPDVSAYFIGSGKCPSVAIESGWHLYLPTPIPAGAQSVSVVLWRGSLADTHTVTLTR